MMFLLTATIFMLALTPETTTEEFDCTKAKNSECFRHMPRVSFDLRCKNDSIMSAFVVVNLLVYRGAFFLFMCGRVGGLEDCRASDFLSGYRDEFRFNCPEGAIISAVEYMYSEAHQDGLFKFSCCKVKGKRPDKCSPWVESGGFKQYVRVAHMEDPNSRTIPTVTGLLSKYVTKQSGDGPYMTREFIVIICNLV